MFKTMELLSACATWWDSRAHPVHVCVSLSLHKHTSRKQTDYPKDAVAPMPDLLFLNSHCGLLTVSQSVLYHPELLVFVFIVLKIFSQPGAEKVHKTSACQ